MMSCSDSCDRAERREAAVLADRVELVAAAGEDLVRVGLVADVPEDLVARRVEQRVERHGDLAGAEVGAEVAADLADRVDDQLADLLRDLLELVVVEALQVGRAVDLVEELGSCGAREDVVGDLPEPCRCRPSASASAARAAAWRLPRKLPRPVESEHTHVGRLAMTLVGAARLSELCLVTRSRRGCRRRSGRRRRALPRSAGTGLWQVRRGPRAPAPTPTDAAISAPVFSSCRWRRLRRRRPRRPRRGTARRPSRACRRRSRPRGPRRARSPARPAARSSASRSASANRPSPARIATSSPKATWQVGLPRRSSSSSIAGRSSWISE